MKYYKRTTQVPNALMDSWMKSLSESEVKVILTIVRRTIGMVDKASNGRTKRLEKAWISHRLFMLYSGLSYKSVSRAIGSLESKGIIRVTNSMGVPIPAALRSKGQDKLFYRLVGWE